MGIDGCRAGWFFVSLDADERRLFGLFAPIHQLAACLPAVETALIDIPIGLRRQHPEERLCDRQARSVLGRSRGSSVFPAPSRCALAAGTYQDASARNRACTGRGLSRQSFGIVGKIREVDDFLRGETGRAKLREMHPEVCFWALNGRQPMSFNKKSAQGYQERLAILSQYCAGAGEIVGSALQRFTRAEVARDDIVDALVGAVVARNAGGLRTFPETPEIDEFGLPMEIAYPGSVR